jgi:hypothetical protein
LSFPFINPCIDKKASPVQRKKKTHPPFLAEERERPILLLFIHQIQNRRPISFHSFSTNAKETEEERPIFLSLQ